MLVSKEKSFELKIVRKGSVDLRKNLVIISPVYTLQPHILHFFLSQPSFTRSNDNCLHKDSSRSLLSAPWFVIINLSYFYWLCHTYFFVCMHSACLPYSTFPVLTGRPLLGFYPVRMGGGRWPLRVPKHMKFTRVYSSGGNLVYHSPFTHTLLQQRLPKATWKFSKKLICIQSATCHFMPICS